MKTNKILSLDHPPPLSPLNWNYASYVYEESKLTATINRINQVVIRKY